MDWYGCIAILIFMQIQLLHGSDESNCNLTLSDLCQTFEQAEACNTTPYCIHCIWNTVIIPKEDEVKCNLCKDEIIEGGVHKVSMLFLLNTTCNLHGNKEDIQKCTHLVRELSLGLINEISTQNMTSHDICALLALCRTLFEVTVSNVDLAPASDAITPSSINVNETLEPVAMAKVGGVSKRRGGRGGSDRIRSGNGSSSSSSSSGGQNQPQYAGGISLPGNKVTGTVTRVSNKFYNAGGRFIPVFVPRNGGRHTCTLMGDRTDDNMDDTEFYGWVVIASILFTLVFFICLAWKVSAGESSNYDEGLCTQKGKKNKNKQFKRESGYYY